MSIPFSNTHQRIPRGFANLLEGLTREVLRDQPKDIPRYAASYFGKLLKEREEAAFDAAEWGAKIEDRFYNDAAFLERSGSQESLKEKPSETLSGDSLEEVCSFDDLFDEESETIIQAQSKGRVSSKEVLEMGSSEVLERVSKESLKMGSSEVLEMVGKESLEMGSIEALAMGSEEELEMESKEVLEMESKEVLEMASKESLEMGREEVLKIRSKEGSKMGSKESLKMGSKEVLKMASKESLEMGRKKVLKMGSKEGLEMGSKEVLKMGSKEVLKMGSKESLKMGSKEVLKMGSKEGLEMESKEALEMGSKEALETRSKEALEIRSKEVLETASKESLKMGSKEVLEMESKEVLKMGSKEGLDMGSKETFEMRSKEALEMGSKEALEMGSKEALEMGSKEALVMGSKEGLVMGSKEGLEMGSKEGLEMGSKEVLKMGSKEGQEMGSKEVLEVEEKEEEEHVEQVLEKDILVDRIEETILKEEILPLYEEENTTARSNISGEGTTHSGLNPGDSYDNFVDEEEIGDTKQENPQEEIESTPEQAEHSENNPNTETKDVTELIKEEHNKADDEMINDLQEEHEIDEANHEQVHQETEMKGQDGGEQYPEPTTHEPLAEMSEQEASEVLSVPPEVATTDDELMEERHQELLIDGSEAKAVQEEDNLDEEVLGKNSNVYSKGEANITEADTMSKQEEEVLDIPLDDPDANAAAAKIQAGFRGHMTRKKMKGGEIDVKGKEREGSGSTSAGGKD